MEKEVRTDRIFPLKDATFYPGTSFCDMVFFYPHIEKKKRLYLLCEKGKPVIFIDHHKFTPVRIKDGKYRWIDYGITDINSGTNGFGQLKVYNIDYETSLNSYFLITTQIKKEIKGSIEEVEKELFGISKEKAGKTFISPSKIIAGTPTEFHFIYNAGEKGLPKNSFIRFCFPRAFAIPQMRNRNADGYIKILKSDCKIRFYELKIPSDESHEKVDLIYYLPDGIKSNGKIELTYRTDFTYLYTSIYDKMERRYWFSNMPPFSTAVATKKKIFVPVAERNGHSVKFISGKPERVHLFFPGRIKERKEVFLTGIITDKYRNPVEEKNWKMKIRIEVEGEENKEIKNISNYLTHRYRFLIPFKNLKPGIYRAKAIDEETGKILAVSNPLKIIDKKSNKEEIFWGEIHGHTEMSDGIGKFENLFKNAREIGTLDFAASADHAEYFTDNQWEWMQDVINNFNEDGKFTTLIGYEWAGKQGHRNIYTSENRLKLFRGMYEPTSNLDIVYKEFENNKNVVAGPHTHHTGDFWSFHNNKVEKFLEIYSMWGIFENLANKLLNEGAIIGFTGGGDCHTGNVFFSPEDKKGQGKIPHGFAYCILYKCGITAAVMKKLDRKNLIYSLRNRKTYATTGDRILIDFNLSGYKMGEIGKTDRVIITLEIHGCEKIKEINVIRNGKIIFIEKYDKMDIDFKFEDRKVEKGNHYYYIKVVQKKGGIAWTSPIWVKVE